MKIKITTLFYRYIQLPIQQLELKNKMDKENTNLIIQFSKLPRKGLLTDFSNVELDQLVEFKTIDFYDMEIFEMQLAKIKARAKELEAQFVVYHIGSNDLFKSDTYLMKFTKNGL